MNSLMNHERKLFVKEHEGNIKMDNVIVFVLVIGIIMALSFLLVFLVVIVAIPFLFF